MTTDPRLTPVKRETCRVCGCANLEFLYSLGTQYVSDFVDKDKVTSGVACPIDIVMCRSCTLVQQQWTAPQEFMYARHYWYRSGVTQTMREALRDVASAAIREADLGSGDVVLDIGSNDGTLLRCYEELECPDVIKVGVEPAKNLAEAGGVGVNLFISDFWNYEAWEYATKEGLFAAFHAEYPPKAKVVTAIGMFYDLDDPNQFIDDVAKVLHPDGVFIAQLQCLKQMVKLGDVGNLCHEHLEFYSLRSLCTLLYKHGLAIYRVEENKVNGGSYRLYAKHYKPLDKVEDSVMDALAKELPLHLLRTHQEFFAKACENRKQCVDFIRREVAADKKVWVYGASTKGNVIAQWYGLSTRCSICGGIGSWEVATNKRIPCTSCGGSGGLIEAAADRSPEKWGKYTVGTGIPIKSEEDFRKANPDYALVLPYGFRDEFLEREKEWRSRGGKFIFPLPQFEVV